MMYDKRDGMVTLANYRRFPHFETKLSEKCLYSVLHSQLCRFAVRCTKIVFFEMAAAKLIVDMIEHSYNNVFAAMQISFWYFRRSRLKAF